MVVVIGIVLRRDFCCFRGLFLRSLLLLLLIWNTVLIVVVVVAYYSCDGSKNSNDQSSSVPLLHCRMSHLHYLNEMVE